MKKVIFVLTILLVTLHITQLGQVHADCLPYNPIRFHIESEFEKAFVVIRKNEGNYSYLPKDKGGETYAGITRRYNRKWKGWKAIDAAKLQRPDSILHNRAGVASVEPQVRSYYQMRWDKAGMKTISSQKVANYVFDFYIHADGTAIKYITKAINDSGVCIGESRKLTKEVVDAINQCDSEVLLSNMIKRRIQLYYKLALKDSTQYAFLNNWVSRSKQIN